MRFLYLVIKFLPYWALPMMLISAELGYIYHRRAQIRLTAGFLLFAFLFFLVTVLYFVFHWNRYGFDWVRGALG